MAFNTIIVQYCFDSKSCQSDNANKRTFSRVSAPISDHIHVHLVLVRAGTVAGRGTSQDWVQECFPSVPTATGANSVFSEQCQWYSYTLYFVRVNLVGMVRGKFRDLPAGWATGVLYMAPTWIAQPR